MTNSIQPSLNMGIVGHVDHGKTTLTKLVSGKWTDTHSEEIKRGITIKLGYSSFDIFFDEKNNKYFNKKGDGLKHLRKISIVDAPGHESLIATMISGAAVMDCALLLIAADEECPQPQTREHLKTLEIAGIKNIIVVQNKIDMIPKDDVLEHYKQIKKFLKGTIIENAPIIPMSAEYGANLDVLLEYIEKYFKSPERDDSKDAIMYVIRSFDINKPGMLFDKITGGIIGGSIKEGSLSVGDEIEIKPGLLLSKGDKDQYKPIETKIISISSEKEKLDTATPGGSIALLTTLDPYISKSDYLVGQIVGKKGTLPDAVTEITFENNLLKKVMSANNEHEVKPIIQNEVFMLIINGLKTVGVVKNSNPRETTIALKKSVMAFDKDKVVIFRRFENNKWHIIGHGIIKV